MISVHNILLNGRPHPIPDHIPVDGDIWYTPVIRARCAVETVWKILVEPVIGAPSSAVLLARFQAAIATSGGGSQTPPTGVGVYTPTGERWYWTDLRPAWTDLNEIEHRSSLPDGDFRQRIASQASGTKLIVRRVKGGFDHRLRFTHSFAGGTTPYFPLSIEAEIRYA